MRVKTTLTCQFCRGTGYDSLIAGTCLVCRGRGVRGGVLEVEEISRADFLHNAVFHGPPAGGPPVRLELSKKK